MGWSETSCLVTRFDSVCELLKQTCSHWTLGTSYPGWLAAQLREQDRLLPMVVGRLRAQMRQLTGRQCVGRWNAFAVDGSDSPGSRTSVNQQALGDKGSTDGMPLVGMTLLFHLGTRLPWSFRVGPGTTSERAQLREMLDELPPDSLLVADAGFVGYELCRDLLKRGQHFLWRVGGNVHLLTELGYENEVRGSTVYLWPGDYRDQPPLQLRLIELRDEQKQPVYLVTSVLDPAELSDAEAAEIYAARWSIEVNYRTLKQTLELPSLRSRKPEACYFELRWAIISAWLLQWMNVRALHAAGVEPRRASPAQTRDAIRNCMRNDPPCRGSRRPLRSVLADCRLDGYRRLRSKASRNYPRKKRSRPPSPPKIQSPTVQQLEAAQKHTPLTCRRQ